MDISLRQELISLVERLTHSGAASLDEELVKRVKGLCKLAASTCHVTVQTSVPTVYLPNSEGI